MTGEDGRVGGECSGFVNGTQRNGADNGFGGNFIKGHHSVLRNGSGVEKKLLKVISSN